MCHRPSANLQRTTPSVWQRGKWNLQVMRKCVIHVLVATCNVLVWCSWQSIYERATNLHQHFSLIHKIITLCFISFSFLSPSYVHTSYEHAVHEVCHELAPLCYCPGNYSGRSSGESELKEKHGVFGLWEIGGSKILQPYEFVHGAAFTESEGVAEQPVGNSGNDCKRKRDKLNDLY